MAQDSPHGFWLRIEFPADDPIYQGSMTAQRQYLTEAARQGRSLLIHRILAGQDRHGQAVAPIGPSTREHRADNLSWVTGERPYSPMGRADPVAPPDAPNRQQSRIIALLTHRIDVAQAGVYFFWRHDNHTGQDWSWVQAAKALPRIVSTYRGKREVPGRDHRGFSDQELRLIDNYMDLWWRSNRGRWKSEAEANERRSLSPSTAWDIPSVPIESAAVEPRVGLFGRLGSMVREVAGRAIGRAFGRASRAWGD